MSVDHHHLHLLVYGIETYRPLQERERGRRGRKSAHLHTSSASESIFPFSWFSYSICLISQHGLQWRFHGEFSALFQHLHTNVSALWPVFSFILPLWGSCRSFLLQRAGDVENSLERIKRQLASGSGRNLLQGPLLKRSETVSSTPPLSLYICVWISMI